MDEWSGIPDLALVAELGSALGRAAEAVRAALRFSEPVLAEGLR